MLATHDYKKNPESPVWNELDVNERDTLVYLMTNEDNEHWWLAEDGKGQVGYVPATYLKIIRDVTRQEEESDTARKEGYGKKTDGTKIGGDMGQDGERRKTYSPHIIGITELWANNDITDAELGLKGYVMFRKDRIGRRGGGVVLYIKESIPAYEVQLQEEADCNEAIWCNLVTGHTAVIIGVVYRCPNITKQNNEKIHNAINEVSKGDCIIMGDFNHGNIKWGTLQSTGVEDSTLLCLVQDNFLTQHVLEPTRAARVLDIVLSSQKEFVDNVEIQEPLGSSDHNQLHFNTNIKSDKTKVKQCRRDFRKGNYREIRKNLAHIDWDEKMKNKTATECWDILRGELDTAIDSYVPMKKQEKRSKKKICQKRLSETCDINKICGGFINIRERIKIMMFTTKH